MWTKILGQDKNYAILLTSVFLIFGIINMAHHELWRDEVQAWLLARDSSSPIALMKNIKYEGHPGLWHLYLFPFTRLTKSPNMMKPLHLLIACICVYLFVKYSPFSRIQKVLFTFGYFMFYEYSVICRNYTIGVLLLFVFCVLFPKRHSSFLILGFILFLTAHTSVHALILVISIGLGVIIDFIISRKYPSKIKLAFGLFLIFAGIITAVIQLNPPADSGWAVAWKTNLDLKHIRASLGNISNVLIPIPRFTFHFWNTHAIDMIPWADNIKFILACLSLIFVTLLYIRTPAVMLMYIAGTLGLCAFFYAKYFGSMRHHGFILVSLVTSCWMMACSYNVKSLPSPVKKLSIWLEKPLSITFTIILLTHLVGGFAAVGMDYVHVFGAGESAANFIKQNGLDEITMVAGDVDHVIMAMAGFLDKQLFYVRGNRWGSYIIWDEERNKSISDEDVLRKAREFSTKEGRESLIIINHPIMPPDSLISLCPIKGVAVFGKAIVGDEVYYLYLLDAGVNRVSHQSVDFDSGWGGSGVLRFTNIIGSTAEYEFEGTGVGWFGYKFDDAGRAEVSIDRKRVAIVDQYGAGRGLPFYWEHSDLPSGRHTIRITLLPEKTVESKDRYINIAGLDIFKADNDSWREIAFQANH